MTVKEFKTLVAEIPEFQDDWTVVVSMDEEGNGFSELSDMGRDEDDHCSQFFDAPSNELFCYNEDDFENFEEFEEQVKEYPHLKPCIVLWP